MKEGNGDWYSLHCLESNKLALEYLKELKNWMLSHPSEVVVLWMTKHGSEDATGDDAYPGVKPSDKQAYWSQIVDLMDGLIIDTTVSSPNSTAINDLVARGHRLIPYVGDYAEFTGDLSKYAMDGSLMDNQLGSSVDSEVSTATQGAKANRIDEAMGVSRRLQEACLTQDNLPCNSLAGFRLHQRTVRLRLRLRYQGRRQGPEQLLPPLHGDQLPRLPSRGDRHDEVRPLRQ